MGGRPGRGSITGFPIAIALALVLWIVGATSVAAAAPGNDTPAGATPVSLGDRIVEVTTEATTDTFEAGLAAPCGAFTVQHGVWFSFDAAATEAVAFDVGGSDYSAGAMVFAGAPSEATFVRCGPNRVVAELTSGQHYTILAFGDEPRAATSGSLVLDVSRAVAAPTVDLSINGTAVVDRSGRVHVSGLVTCTSSDGSGSVGSLFGELTQRVGRTQVHGPFDAVVDVPCDGAAHAWDAYAIAGAGRFGAGKAVATASALGCTDACVLASDDATIRLRRK